MTEPLRFHPLVTDDLAVATEWYDELSADLGNRFRQAVNARFDSIELSPQWFGRVQGEFRAARIDGFPYLIVFLNDGRATEVLGVFHAAADPDKWTGRKR